MNIRFRQSGGFAGMERAAELKDAELSPVVREVANAAFLKTPDAAPPLSPGAADVTRYSLVLENQGEERKLDFDDLSVPPELHPLLGDLIAASHPVPLD